VVIPTRVGRFDVGGIRPVIGFCQDLRQALLFVLAGTDPKAPGWSNLVRDTNKALKEHGPVAAKTIRERAAYIAALNSGKGGSVVGESTDAAFDALWQAIKNRAGLR
jgi:hypothetical protein